MAEPLNKHKALGLTTDDLLEMYRYMVLARAFDQKAVLLWRQGRIAFTVTGSGQEGAQVGAAWAFRKGLDLFLPYYRDLAFVMVMGMTPEELMLSEFARAADPNSGGRQMPKHFGCKRLGIYTRSSPVGNQYTQAAGVGLAVKIKREDRVVYVSGGDGSVSKGDFYEGVNFAAIHRLPVIFFCQNNQYTISVPLKLQSPVNNLAQRAKAFQIPGERVDGNDVLEVYAGVKQAVDRARQGLGPSFIVADTYRLDPHTTNDDDRRYRSKSEIDIWRKNDPIIKFARYLSENGLISEEDANIILHEATQTVEKAVRFAEAQPMSEGNTALKYVYAEEGDGR
jgi:2-oxoisovalerate dehydrogenase E1 component alpha subunit